MYFACSNCDFVFVSRNFLPTEEAEKKRYLAHKNDTDSVAYLSYVEENLRQINFILEPNKKFSILDYGCGREAILSELLSKQGHQVQFYDKYFYPQQKYLELKYDLILLIEVLEHLHNPFLELMDLCSLLNLEGRIIIRTEPLVFDENFFKNWWYARDITHTSFFNFNSLSVLAEKFNKKAIEIKNNFFVIN